MDEVLLILYQLLSLWPFSGYGPIYSGKNTPVRSASTLYVLANQTPVVYPLLRYEYAVSKLNGYSSKIATNVRRVTKMNKCKHQQGKNNLCNN
jgi:hypothetical protein